MRGPGASLSYARRTREKLPLALGGVGAKAQGRGSGRGQGIGKSAARREDVLSGPGEGGREGGVWAEIGAWLCSWGRGSFGGERRGLGGAGGAGLLSSAMSVALTGGRGLGGEGRGLGGAGLCSAL